MGIEVHYPPFIARLRAEAELHRAQAALLRVQAGRSVDRTIAAAMQAVARAHDAADRAARQELADHTGER